MPQSDKKIGNAMIGDKVALSAGRMAGVQLLAKALDAIALVVVARFLTPEDFGLVALAASILLVANSLTSLPVVDVLVQKPELDERLIHTAFTLTVLRGALIAMLLWLIAEPLAVWLDDPRLAQIVRVIALGPLVEGFASPNMVGFLRAVNYVPLAWSRLIGRVASFCAVVAVAWVTQSWWALVAGLVVAPAVTACATHLMAPYRPRLRLRGMFEILPFAGWVTLSQMIFTLNQQADRFFVGAILGKAPLGQYAMAGSIASMASWTIATPVMQPLFSGFSRMTHDVPRLTRAYLKGQQIMVSVIAPLGFGVAAVAESLIPLVFGPQWNPSIPLIWWLGPTIALQMMSVPVHSLTMARARPRLLVFRELVSLGLRLPLTILAAWTLGLQWAVIVRCLASLLMVGFNLSLATRLLDVSVTHQLRACSRAVLAASIMAGGIVLFQHWVPAVDDVLLSTLRLTGAILFGAVLYAVALFGLWGMLRCPDGAETWMLGLCRRRLKVA